MNEYFPRWVTANAIIPKLIRGNVKPRVNFDKSDAIVSLVDFHTSDLEMIPKESLERFEEVYAMAQSKVIDRIGFKPESFHGKPASNELKYEIQSEIIGRMKDYERNNDDSIDNLLMEYMGVMANQVLHYTHKDHK